MCTIKRAFAAVTFLLCCSLTSAQAASITWKILIGPKNSGSVAWVTSSPAASGSLSASGKITFNSGAYVDLTFTPNTGGTLQLVTKNADNITSQLDANHHFRFGPVDAAHTIGVLFSGGGSSGGGDLGPTGVFGLKFPNQSATLAPVFDISGNYKGVAPFKTPRAFNFDLAMDEFGKVSAMGNLQGVAASNGSSQLTADVGAVKTVDNKPTNFLNTKFQGTLDGLPVSGSAKGSGPVPTQFAPDGTGLLSGTGSYKGDYNGVKYANPSVSVQLPIPGTLTKNLTKAWTIQLTITSDATSGKPKLSASAVLTLPNGDVITFPKRPAKYSATKGYSLSYKGGTNVSRSPAAKDKGSSVKITGMTISKQTSGVVNGGTIEYKFLGQSGKGNLVEFLP